MSLQSSRENASQSISLGMQAGSRRAQDNPHLAQGVSLLSFIKRPRILMAWLWMLPQTLKSLISSSPKTHHQGLSPRSCVMAGNTSVFSVTPIRDRSCTQRCRELAMCGDSFMLTRHEHGSSRAPERRGSCDGMLRNTKMAAQVVAIQMVHGCISVTPAAVCCCSGPS